MEASILVKMIKAATIHASKKDCRYYLNGVYFDIAGDQLCLVGTDGHRLIELKTKILNSFSFHGSFILGHDVLKVLLAQLATGKEVYLKSFDGMSAVFEINGSEFSYISIDAKYPDYHRVIRAHDNTTAQFTNEYGLNISYLADIQKSCKLFKRKFDTVKLSIKDVATSIKWEACLDNDHQVFALGLIMPAKL